MNKHRVFRRSRRCFTETDVKHFKKRALRTIRNIAEKDYGLFGELQKIILSQVYIKDFAYRYRTVFTNVNFFTGIFKDFVDRFGTTYLKNGLIHLIFFFVSFGNS